MEHGQVSLIADIGRLSVRFGLTGGPAGPAPREVERFLTADQATFTGALLSYLRPRGLDGQSLPSALAVAGAVHGDLVSLTGSRWHISLSGIEAVLRVRPRAINECAANALALTTLPSRDFIPLSGPVRRDFATGGTFLVIGLGTGLGVAGLIARDGRLTPIQSEAAHMSFAPTTDDEAKLVAHLVRRGVRVSNEAVLGAAGLLAAHAALGDGRTPAARAEDVTRNAGRDPAATAAIATFAGALGAVIGDLVLAFGAWDGVFLTGAIARALQPRLAGSTMRQRMEAKGAFRRQLSQVPVTIVARDDLELVGAAAALSGG